MKSWTAAVLGSFLAMTGCNPPPSTLEEPIVDEEPTPPEPAVHFAPSLEAAEQELFYDQYTLLGQRDIIAVVDLPAPEGTQYVRFDLLNPQGAIHQTSWIPINSDPAMNGVMAKHPLANREFPIEAVTEKDGFVRFNVRIGIAGTNFSRFRLTGPFRAEVRYGTDEGAPLAHSTFEMYLR